MQKWWGCCQLGPFFRWDPTRPTPISPRLLKALYVISKFYFCVAMFQTGCSTNRLLRYATVSINKGHTWYVLHAHEWLLISDATSSKELHRPCAVYESLLCTWKTRRLWFLFLFPFWHEFDPFLNANRFLYLVNWKQPKLEPYKA